MVFIRKTFFFKIESEKCGAEICKTELQLEQYGT